MKLVFLDAKSDCIYPNYGDKIDQLSYIITDENYNILDFKNFSFDKDESSDKAFRCFSDEIYEDLKCDKIIFYDMNYCDALIRSEFNILGIKQLPFNHLHNIMCSSCSILELDRSQFVSNKYKLPKLDYLVEYLNISDREIKSVLNAYFDELIDCYDTQYNTVCIYLLRKEFDNIEEKRRKKIRLENLKLVNDNL